eukprot:TRINITY_DN97378_c0_g1_i1.p2 TRINITY_DN97378_c0_g1~~TRINITY_DN97378_c0_g1_i1.p2  ORF type:complete len:125 (+),score=48.02 TRINITY_DN97378_c0_g1_i1:49-375(+)
MASHFIPRVNAELLQRYVGSTVRLVGQVKAVEEKTAVVEASDGRDVTVRVSDPQHFVQQQFVEVVGHVEQDLSVRQDMAASFGASFDMANYNQALKLMNGKYQYIFAG